MNKILIFTLGLSLTPVVMAEKTTKDLTTIDQYSGISWVRKPQVRVTDRELEGKSRQIIVRVHVNTFGNIERTEITKNGIIKNHMLICFRSFLSFIISISHFDS